jgi:uncharacterized tellurite resistance protein B-like protein
LSLLRFLGLGGKTAGRDEQPESIAELTTELESLPLEEARFVAAFAYLLARVAGADLHIDEVEESEIVRHLEQFGQIPAERAGLLTTSALRMVDSHSSTDDHLVARAFRDMSEAPERLRLLRCLYAVAAADETISTTEDNEIFRVASSIGVPHEQVIGLRSEFKQYLGSMKALSTER